MTKGNTQYHTTIKTQYAAIAADLQGLNAYRYDRNITGGNQEFIEAAAFEHYLTTGSLLPYDEACRRFVEFGGDAGAIPLSPEDYLLGLFDMTGELMRFAVTAMATDGKLPSSSGEDHPSLGEEGMDVDAQEGKRDVLTDLRELRAQMEGLEIQSGWLARDVDKKMDVMRTSVEKVERALYGLVIRGRERPKGWMPDLDGGGRRTEVDVEA